MFVVATEKGQSMLSIKNMNWSTLDGGTRMSNCSFELFQKSNYEFQKFIELN